MVSLCVVGEHTIVVIREANGVCARTAEVIRIRLLALRELVSVKNVLSLRQIAANQFVLSSCARRIRNGNRVACRVERVENVKVERDVCITF